MGSESTKYLFSLDFFYRYRHFVILEGIFAFNQNRHVIPGESFEEFGLGIPFGLDEHGKALI